MSLSPARKSAPSNPFSSANPHALATILEASQTRSIIASRDIFDISGIKLWARDQPVSGALQRKLLDRQLRNPLESCLEAQDGVTTHSLVQAVQALVEDHGPLAPLLKPHAARIVQEVGCLPLHPVAQLLLTASQASRPEAFQHAVHAMALAGALLLEHGGTLAELRMALLGGLLHDLGEIYIDPRYGEADADRSLDFTSYQQLVVHPHVGRLLLTQLTNYPSTLGRAIGEHHERMDGSGYPHSLRRDAMSPLGRLLAVTEATLGVLRGGESTAAACGLSRASVALRVVPGEYDLAWVGAISNAARAGVELPLDDDTTPVLQRLVRLDSALQAAQQCANTLASSAQTTTLKDAIGLVQHLLGRLRAGWYASGLWSHHGVSTQDAAEVEAVEAELSFRLRSIERAALLRAGELGGEEALRLGQLCRALRPAP
ncbi:MAG TPA: HD domain-containing phosphohydrolase [Rubrivivax sp.]|nr:HD domain-containing phosphohydrolase [Rubrivivax sp.]